MMKPILSFFAPAALKTPKSVLKEVRRRRISFKTDFYNKNY
ncbi:hypothetical protein APA_5253 [Pseudanabaena sp. lw0831]|nr:hypothetical protein APA_5253 [Pseudanabaena sp. lw0831]